MSLSHQEDTNNFSIISALNLYEMTLAGLPTEIEKGGKSLVTTLPAPTMAPWEIFTPLSIIELFPIQQSEPIYVFSGFGLGTLLLPVFALFFDIEVAILATALVHFSAGIFKFLLTMSSINFSILIRFGITAVLGAYIGSFLVSKLSHDLIIYNYEFLNFNFKVELINFIIGVLMILFAFIELLPTLKTITFNKKYLPLGGFISGFFGGFSGHQGALRSAFLSKTKIENHVFIATSVSIAMIIDLVRVSSYFQMSNFENLPWKMISFGVLFALTGTFFGKRYFDKKQNINIRLLVSVFLFLIGMAMILGFI